MLLGAEVDGVIVGAAAWIPPEAYPVSLARQVLQVLDLLPSLPWGWRSLREAQRGQAGNRQRHRVHPDHFYLRAIGVDPVAQSRGLGSSLIRPVLDLADRRSVGCFLQTATAANVTWYERFGTFGEEPMLAHRSGQFATSWPPSRLVRATWRHPSRAMIT